MSVIKEIREALPIQDYVSMVNEREIGKSISQSFAEAGTRGASPFDATSEMQAWAQYWIEYATGKHGDIIDFCAHHQFDGDRGQAIDYLSHLTGAQNNGQTPPTESWIEYTQRLCDTVAYWSEHMYPAHRDMLHAIGITDDTISRLHIGTVTDGPEQGRLCVPTTKSGYIAGYATLAMQGGAYPDRKWILRADDGHCERTIWGLGSVVRDPYHGIAIVAEDALDALPFDAAGVSQDWAVFSAVTGEFSGAMLAELILVLREYRKVYLVDPSERLMRRLLSDNIPFAVVHAPKGYSNVGEYYARVYADEHPLADLLDDAIIGVVALAKTLSPRQNTELAHICHMGTRHMRKTETIKAFAEIAKLERWDKDYLKALMHECSTAPSEVFIANEVCRRHQLIYNEKFGVFEYTGRFWHELDESILSRYINDELGPYATGSRLSSIKRLVIASCATARRPDESNVYNFLNGTLEIDPVPKLRPHRAGDFCTHLMPYPYNENAVSPVWQQYLNNTLDGKQDKITLLQESCGYIFYPDQSLQAAFFLVGEGNNGKSVLFDAIRNVFGSNRTSTVSTNKFDKPFETVRLSTSVVNLCGELSGDMSASLDAFKAVTGGEKISACYKGKDFFDFHPRSKLFSSCNNLPKLDDSSKGFIRRCIFIHFGMNFVTDGSPLRRKNDRRGDTDLTKKLRTPEELSGIFSWMLEGYYRLKAQGHFSFTDESENMKAEYRLTIDPVFGFLSEQGRALLGERIEGRALYDVYTSWCESTGHVRASSTRFFVRAARAISELFPEYEEYRSGTSRHCWRKVGDA